MPIPINWNYFLLFSEDCHLCPWKRYDEAGFTNSLVTEVSTHHTQHFLGTQNMCSTEKQSETKLGGRGHWAAYYTSPQIFIIRFSCLLA